MSFFSEIKRAIVKRLDPEPGIADFGGGGDLGNYTEPAPETQQALQDAGYHDPRHPTERAYAEQFSGETELVRALRQRDEYFGIIERIEQERDGLWVMYRVEVSEHLNAQALLERRLMESRRQIARAIAMLNKMRKDADADLEPINKPADLEPYEGEPIGTAREYADNMIELCKRFPEVIEGHRPNFADAKKERGAVVKAVVAEGNGTAAD